MLLAGAGCGDDGGGDRNDGSVKDGPGGGDRTSIPDAYRPDWAGMCDPIAQNCASGFECLLMCPQKEFNCGPETGGTKNAGESCNVGECKKGMICVMADGVARCRIWCKDDSDCGAGRLCLLLGVTCPPDTASNGRLCTP
jgi:hypothetical protein